MILVQIICPNASIPTIPVKAIKGNRMLSTGMETALEAKTRVHCGHIRSCTSGPELIDLGIDQLSEQSREDGAQDDPHLQGEYRLPPGTRGVYDAEKKCPCRLASTTRPVSLGRQQNNQLKIESSEQIDAGRQPDSGDGRLLAKLFMDQISPGESEGVDETGIHDQAAEICDLGGSDVSGQGEEQVKAAKYYGGLCSVHPKFACYEFGCIDSSFIQIASIKLAGRKFQS